MIAKAAMEDYKRSPGSLKKLLECCADGVNYFFINIRSEACCVKHFEPGCAHAHQWQHICNPDRWINPAGYKESIQDK